MNETIVYILILLLKIFLYFIASVIFGFIVTTLVLLILDSIPSLKEFILGTDYGASGRFLMFAIFSTGIIIVISFITMMYLVAVRGDPIELLMKGDEKADSLVAISDESEIFNDQKTDV